MTKETQFIHNLSEQLDKLIGKNTICVIYAEPTRVTVYEGVDIYDQDPTLTINVPSGVIGIEIRNTSVYDRRNKRFIGDIACRPCVYKPIPYDIRTYVM